MDRENAKRVRLLKIWELLNQESDEEHPMRTDTLLAKLAEFGIECDRRTVYADIRVLNDFGYEILKNRGQWNEYYVVDRSFDVPEVQILMDAVQAAGFITEKKTKELVDKIAQLAGSQRGQVLKQNIVQFGTAKSQNESIYYSVNEITTAIINHRKICFHYFDYDYKGNRVYRKGRKNPEKARWYVVNPLGTIFSDDNYYLFCYDDWHQNIIQFRVDRMDQVTMMREEIKPNPKAEDFDLAAHKRQLFEMFNGEPEVVSLEVEKSLTDLIIDKFGDVAYITDGDNNLIRVTLTVQVSPMFIGWCCSYGNRIKVTGPTHVIKAVKAHIEELRQTYGGDQ